MKYIEKLDLQTEEVTEAKPLEKHIITNSDPISVDEYKGHDDEFLAVGEEYDDGFNQLKETNGLGISCIVSKEVKEARKDVNGNIHEKLKDRIDSEVNNLKSSLDNKTNLNNNKIVIENSKDDTSPALNVYNKNMQGTFPLGGTNAGIVLHNYTDAPAMQIDNVGVNSALVINLANNPTNRPDKESHFCGNGNFISTYQTYFDGDTKKTKSPFRISNLAEFVYADGYNPYIRIKSDDNNSDVCLTMLCEKPHKNTFSLINSSQKYYNHTNNTQDYSYNYNSTRHNIFNFNNTGQAVFNNNVSSGYSYVFNGNSSDGSIFKINGNKVFQIMEYSTFANAISLKPITDDTVIPINTIFMDGEGNLKFKNFNGEVKTINLS